MVSARCVMKIVAVVGVAALVIYKLQEFSETSRGFFIEKNKIVKGIDDVKHSELTLNYVISASSLYLYKNNDAIIDAIEDLQDDLRRLLKNRYFQEEYPKIYAYIERYRHLIRKKVENVYEFQSYNSAIKNSTMYLALLLRRFSQIQGYKSSSYKQRFVDAVSKIFLSKNSIDKDIAKSIDIEYFDSVLLKDEALQRINGMFASHLRIFRRYYPKYNALLLEILDAKTQELLDRADREIYKRADEKVQEIRYALFFLIGFIVLFAALVIALIIKSERENARLSDLTKRLQETMRVDALTRLYNRFKYDEDIASGKYRALYLINIDRFKYINDYYGTKIGDKVLQKVATVLRRLSGSSLEVRLYRLGADDFGILTQEHRLQELEKLILQYFEKHEINVGEFQFKISVSIAFANDAPLLENANIALKKVKSSSRLKFLAYSPQIDNKEQILQNIQRTKELYDALEKERIIPYFQGIAHIQTEKIVKYEVLARIVKPSGAVESIFPYLQIAKDNKLYARLTRTIFMQSIKRFRRSDVAFNINVSIEDILDDSIIELVDEVAHSMPEVMRRITFEILESESIGDYNAIKNFITHIKTYGAKAAIDDFGSGYSNFEHLLNLEVDYIKIDGSLIKNVATDTNAYNIVRLITQFARQSGIETVAEFVENEAIFTTLGKLGVDFAQGYYVAKPTSEAASELKR